MGVRWILKPTQSSDDASVQLNAAGTGGTQTTNATNMALTSSSNLSTQSIRCFGVRFPGTNVIPAGTLSINNAQVSLWINSSASLGGSGINGGVDCQIRMQAKTTISDPIPSDINSNTFSATDPGGTFVYRMNNLATTGSVHWLDPETVADKNTQRFTPDLFVLFKELMIRAGATFAISNPADPGFADDRFALTGTTKNISNLVVLFCGGNTSFYATGFNSFDSANNTDLLSYVKIPTLSFTTTASDDIIEETDRRVHIAILSDSIGWSMQPDMTLTTPSTQPGYIINNYAKTYFGGYPEASTGTSYLSSTQFYSLLRVDNANRGYIAFFDNNGKAYADTQPELGISQEGRSGFTYYGVLKDQIMKHFGVPESDIVIHPFGIGGTTASNPPGGLTTGIWDSTYDLHDKVNSTYTHLPSGITAGNLSSSLSPITNSLWLWRDVHGHNMLELLQDTTVNKLLIVFSGGGNDTFSPTSVSNTTTALLPYTNNSGNSYFWLGSDNNSGFMGSLRDSITNIGRFCHEIRSAVGAAPIEFLVNGYPNWPVDEPRIPKINVFEGQPTSNANKNAFHRNYYPSGSTSAAKANNPDIEYGGTVNGSDPQNGSDTLPTWGGSSSYMSPHYGPNPIPQIPFFATYAVPSVFGGPISNVDTFATIKSVGDGNGTLGEGSTTRPMIKYDLGYFLNFKLSKYLLGTFQYSWSGTGSTGYNAWYTHWAADHYGSKYVGDNLRFGYPGGTDNVKAWNATVAIFGGGILNYDPGDPYPSGQYSYLAVNESLKNLSTAVAYSSRNITNETVNDLFINVTERAHQDAVTALQNLGIRAIFAKNRYCHGGNPLGDSDIAANDPDPGDPNGSATYNGHTYSSYYANLPTVDINGNTLGKYQSGGRWAFLDGVHMTYEGSQQFCNSIIRQATADPSSASGYSQYLAELTVLNPLAISAFMSFFSNEVG